jgi:hypothetical protein
MTLKRFEISDDDSKEIIEVAGDTSGDLADAFHFLSLVTPLFGRFALGQVTRDLGKSDDLAFRIPDRIDHDARPEPAAVLSHAPAFRLVFSGVGCGVRPHVSGSPTSMTHTFPSPSPASIRCRKQQVRRM